MHYWTVLHSVGAGISFLLYLNSIFCIWECSWHPPIWNQDVHRASHRHCKYHWQVWKGMNSCRCIPWFRNPHLTQIDAVIYIGSKSAGRRWSWPFIGFWSVINASDLSYVTSLHARAVAILSCAIKESAVLLARAVSDTVSSEPIRFRDKSNNAGLMIQGFLCEICAKLMPMSYRTIFVPAYLNVCSI